MLNKKSCVKQTTGPSHRLSALSGKEWKLIIAISELAKAVKDLLFHSYLLNIGTEIGCEGVMKWSYKASEIDMG